MKTKLFIVFSFLVSAMMSCQTDGVVDPQPEPQRTSPISHIIGRDSIFAGAYLGINIGGSAVQAYEAVQQIRLSKGVNYLNVVSNFSSDIARLQNRIPLYNYILLDETRGTGSGVQITLENGKVKAIYLNSGVKLKQWPLRQGVKSSVRIGDKAGELHSKLLAASKVNSYANKFQRIFLLTKNISTAFDPEMSVSPQWYFTVIQKDGFDVIKVNFIDNKVSFIEVEYYRD